LKLGIAGDKAVGITSPPARGRGLKLRIRLRAGGCGAGRPPRGGVD